MLRVFLSTVSLPSFIETEVTIGEENDYYVEVSGSGIKEGSEILADLTNDDGTTEAVQRESEGKV